MLHYWDNTHSNLSNNFIFVCIQDGLLWFDIIWSWIIFQVEVNLLNGKWIF